MTYSGEVLADTPLAYYRLGDASGTVMADSSGNAHDGAYAGTPTLGTAGLLGGDADTAVSFNGSTDNGSTPSAVWMDTDYVTVEAIIQPTALGATKAIVSRKPRTGGEIWELFVDSTGVLAFVWWDWNTGSPTYCYGVTALQAGTAHHVAAAFSGASATVYLNGAADGTATQGNGAAANRLQRAADSGIAAPIAVACSSSAISTTGDPSYFSGIIDEAAVYGTALTAARIGAHFTAANVTTALPAIQAGSDTTDRDNGVIVGGISAASFTATPVAPPSGIVPVRLGIMAQQIGGTA